MNGSSLKHVAVLNVGGVVAIGFDESGRHMLVVSHSGRGVYDGTRWQRVYRDVEVVYPVNGVIGGIGPIAGQTIAVVELDYDTESLETFTPDGRFSVRYEEGAVNISDAAAKVRSTFRTRITIGSMDTLPYEPARPATGKGMLWTGRVLSAIVVLMMGVGGVAMLVHPAPSMAENMTKFGWPDAMSRTILIVEVACAIVYAIPQTAVLGAILITGYLGGAVATHLRVGDPGWPAPIVFGIVAWLGLVLRDARLRSVLPLRRI